MRALLGSAGDIRRDEGETMAATEAGSISLSPPATTPRSALVLREAIVVRDMRCVLPVADRVLRSLALLGATSANSAAESLRMPLRTVQAVLQQLVAEGACTIERDGRRVAYRIEDTTFTDHPWPEGTGSAPAAERRIGSAQVGSGRIARGPPLLGQ